MKKDDVQGLRLFLLEVLNLVSKRNKETCVYVQEKISQEGIATALTQKYEIFKKYPIQPEYIEKIDNYYRDNWSGVSEGNEMKYFCDEDDGLQLVVALALNEIY